MSTYVIRAPGSGIPDVHVMRGESVPKITGGGAKWETVDRPKRKGATRYTGQDPWELDLPIQFEGWKDRNQQEPDISNLLRMTQEVGGRPPQVQIVGGIPRRGLKWVITGIDWGDAVIYDFITNGSLVRFRQDAVVHLREFVDVEAVHLSSKPPGNSRGTTPKGAKHLRHTVKKGETLPGIAVQEYGDRSKWRDIATANKIRDPRSIKVGQVLKLP